jgi:hypothetical protein
MADEDNPDRSRLPDVPAGAGGWDGPEDDEMDHAPERWPTLVAAYWIAYRDPKLIAEIKKSPSLARPHAAIAFMSENGMLASPQCSLDEAKKLLLSALEASQLSARDELDRRIPNDEWRLLQWHGPKMDAKPRPEYPGFTKSYKSITVSEDDVLGLWPREDAISAAGAGDNIVPAKVDEEGPHKKAKAAGRSAHVRKAYRKRLGRPPDTGYRAQDAPLVEEAISIIKQTSVNRTVAVKKVIGTKGDRAEGASYSAKVRRLRDQIPWPLQSDKKG